MALCLPILKLSRAVGVRNDNSIPWVHITASDLFVTVNGGDTNRKLQMRVIQRNTVLESLDVGDYIDSANRARHLAQQTGTSIQIDKLPIFGITKDALLALRYQQPDGQARRLQLRMRTVAECGQILGLFQRRGMQFSDQRLHTARPGTKSSDNRLLTAAGSSPYDRQPPPEARANPFVLPPLEAGSFSRHGRSSAVRPESQSQSLSNLSQAKPYSLQSPFFTRDETTAPREAEPTRPTTAQIHKPHTHQLLPPPLVFPRQPYATHQEPRSTVTGAMDVEHAIHSDKSRSTNLSHSLTSLRTSPPPPPTAPSLPSAATSFPDTLEHEIPPRRELPFKRPASARSTSDRSNSRPSSSALQLPPLPRPNVPKDSPGAPTEPRSYDKAIGRPSSSSPLKRSWEVQGGGTTRDQPTVDTLTVPPSRSLDKDTAAFTYAHPLTSAPKLGPMDQLLGRKMPLAERSPNARLNSLADAPHGVVSSPPGIAQPPRRPENLQEGPSKASADFTIHPLGNAYTITNTDESSALTGYAAQSREDRAATLDEFMASKLEDSSFTTLCEDVENCWRRIALGL